MDINKSMISWHALFITCEFRTQGYWWKISRYLLLACAMYSISAIHCTRTLQSAWQIGIFGWSDRIHFPVMLSYCTTSKQKAHNIKRVRFSITRKASATKCGLLYMMHQMETFSALLAICAGKFTDHRWIPRTKASDAKLWCFLWSAPE